MTNLKYGSAFSSASVVWNPPKWGDLSTNTIENATRAKDVSTVKRLHLVTTNLAEPLPPVIVIGVWSNQCVHTSYLDNSSNSRFDRYPIGLALTQGTTLSLAILTSRVHKRHDCFATRTITE